MNQENKILKTVTVVIRVLFGALLLFASIPYFFKLIPTPELAGDMKIFNEGINAAGYLMPLVKGIELICGLAFITGRFVPLATVVIFPIVVNIVGVHTFLAPEGLPVAIFMLLANTFLAYRCRENYRGLFAIK